MFMELVLTNIFLQKYNEAFVEGVGDQGFKAQAKSFQELIVQLSTILPLCYMVVDSLFYFSASNSTFLESALDGELKIFET